MSKAKGRQPKSVKAPRHVGRRNRPPAKTSPPQVAEDPSQSSTPPPRPAGQLLFDMPYSSQVPSPVRPDLGLTSLIARAGHNAGYDIDLTLLDAADHRLIRTGVLLAHRVLDGRGEWYLGAPDWVPLLPKELIVPMGQTELPDDIAELVRPFRRGTPLSPVAALRCERREFALRNDTAQTVALLRDDKVTVRRNGLTTARYREVMMTPVGPGLDDAQAQWLRECLNSAGATELDRFPRLVRRLGAPATGPSDLPVPAQLSGGTFGQLVTQLLGAGARDLISGDLAIIQGLPAGEAGLVESVTILRRRLEGLREVLGQEWVDDAIEDLEWLVTDDSEPVGIGAGRGWPGESPRSDDLAALGGPSTPVDGQVGTPLTGCRARLRSRRYLTLLDRLIAAARAPRIGVEASQPATQGVEEMFAASLGRFTRAADRLAVEGTAQTWDAAWSAAQQVQHSAVVRALVDPERTAVDAGRLQPAIDLLERACRADQEAAEIMAGLDSLTSSEAFEAGRVFERDRSTARTVRSEFVGRWAKIRRKLG